MSLYETMRGRIVSGVYAPGEKLPSKRDAASAFGVSVITVEQAYSLLCDEGYAVSRPRSGYYCAFTPGGVAFASSVRIDPPAINRAGTREGTFSFPIYAKTVRTVLSDKGDAIFEKTDGKGSPELRSALVRYLSRSRGIEASEEDLIVGSGAEQLYSLVIGLLGPDKTYAYEIPSYEQIENIYRSNGVKLLPLELGRDGISSDALAAADADALHVLPYRSFPEGIPVSASKRAEYLAWAKNRSAVIIEDDFESEFAPALRAYETLFSMSGGDGVIYVNSFSKTIAPSVRIAYMLLPDELRERYDRRLSFLSCPVPALEQYVLARILDNGDLERHVNRVRRRRSLS